MATDDLLALLPHYDTLAAELARLHTEYDDLEAAIDDQLHDNGDADDTDPMTRIHRLGDLATAIRSRTELLQQLDTLRAGGHGTASV